MHQYYWLVDTRLVWNPLAPRTSSRPSNALGDSASVALSRVPQDEREKALRFHFHSDAKMSLASSLLKRHFITTCFPSTSFPDVQLSRRGDPKHGKPSYDPRGQAEDMEVDFNVSHQAGLVALTGYARSNPAITQSPHSQNVDPSITLGVDITNTGERTKQDHNFISRSGLADWVDMHGDVFSPQDLAAMKQPEVDEFGCELPEWDGNDGIDKYRRKFYAYWCLKEAYVKLEGEALLAGWLKEVEFRNVRVPEEGGKEREWGEKVDGIEVWRKGVKERQTRMELRAWGQHFLIGLAVKGDDDRALEERWEILDIEKLGWR
ncbi:MAG: hypothetical protein Q9162_004702 [Coniocarpon cinnabarinum]